MLSHGFNGTQEGRSSLHGISRRYPRRFAANHPVTRRYAAKKVRRRGECGKSGYVVRRRTILASSNRRDWPADRDLHEALTHGSLALELMSSSDKTPARQSPSARLIFLLTFRHLYEISSFQLTSSAKLVLAYPNLGSIYYGFHSSILTFYTVFNTAMFTPFEQSADERHHNKNRSARK